MLDILILNRVRSIRENKRIEKENARRALLNAERGDDLKKAFCVPISCIVNYGFCKYVLVSEKASQVMIDGDIFSFSQILKYHFRESYTEDVSPITFTSTTNTGNMLWRSFLGGFFGSSGRIIGGATAKRSTTMSGGEIKRTYDYALEVTMDTLSRPLIRLEIGQDKESAMKLRSLFEIIIERNRKS